MTSFARVAAMIAIALMLAPASIGISGPAGTGAELAGNKPAYPACGFAKRGRICWSGQGLVSGGGHRRR
jgi:hypothetical protein